MIALAFQLVVCLLVAAAIGAAVGWMLRHRSAESHAQSLTDLETELRVKGQALDTAIYELKVKTSAVMALESKVASIESLGRSAQEELASRQDRIDRLQQDLKENQACSQLARSESQTQLERLADQETTLAAFANEVRQSNAAGTKVQEELAGKEQELVDLQQRLVEADRWREEFERLRTKLEELEPAQGRLHWLEVQLSEKDAHHRQALHRLEQDVAARDRRLAEQTEQTLLLEERDRRITTLEQRLAQLHALQAELAGQAKIMGDQEEEISRLRKRLGEVRAALRVREARRSRARAAQWPRQSTQPPDAGPEGDRWATERRPEKNPGHQPGHRACAQQDGHVYVCADRQMETK